MSATTSTKYSVLHTIVTRQIVEAGSEEEAEDLAVEMESDNDEIESRWDVAVWVGDQ